MWESIARAHCCRRSVDPQVLFEVCDQRWMPWQETANIAPVARMFAMMIRHHISVSRATWLTVPIISREKGLEAGEQYQSFLPSIPAHALRGETSHAATSPKATNAAT